MSFSNGVWSIVSFLLVFPISGAFAQATSPSYSKTALVPKTIHQLFLDDQSDRTGDRKVAPYAPDVHSRDALRREGARKLLAAGEIKSAADFHDAAYIFQHGDDADDYLLAHILAVESIVKGDATSKWISAATLDRYLQAIGKSQVFGTQYASASYLYLAQHKNDPDVMNKPEAKAKGMTQEPYDRKLVPDPLRSDFCVADLGQQSANLKEFEAGRYPAAMIPAGCTR